MYFTLEALPAHKGDCLLLHYGSKNDPRMVVIDGGPSKVYRPHLRPRLKQIHAARGLAASKPLPLDMVMVSHIDDDHIRGILEMTRELTKAKDDRKPLAWRIRSLWHNSFDSIVVYARSATKDMLLTGDARGDKIIKGLEKAGLLRAGRGLNLDILKLPHHGSENNVTTAFFRRVRAKHYIASGDGKHGNPERETFEMLFKARGRAAFDIHLTYPVKDIDKIREEEADKDYRKGRRSRRWNTTKDSLASLFRKQKAAGARFRLHEPDDSGRITVDLRTPIDF